MLGLKLGGKLIKTQLSAVLYVKIRGLMNRSVGSSKDSDFSDGHTLSSRDGWVPGNGTKTQ